MPHWEHFHHQADIGVRGVGATPLEAFVQAATALTAVVTDPATVRPLQSLTVACKAPDLELLLVDWLNALVFEMATRTMLFSQFDIILDGTQLTATVYGEPVDVTRHQPAVEVKGATYTELKIKQLPDGQWLAQCVVDV